jgi:hypothetical protein
MCCEFFVLGFPQRCPEFDPTSGIVEFVMEEVALGWVFSDYFYSPFP